MISAIGAEWRFASAVASRLAQLGALTQGDRRATGANDMSEFSVDNQYGAAALRALLLNLREVAKGKDAPLKVNPPFALDDETVKAARNEQEEASRAAEEAEIDLDTAAKAVTEAESAVDAAAGKDEEAEAEAVRFREAAVELKSADPGRALSGAEWPELAEAEMLAAAAAVGATTASAAKVDAEASLFNAEEAKTQAEELKTTADTTLEVCQEALERAEDEAKVALDEKMQEFAENVNAALGVVEVDGEMPVVSVREVAASVANADLHLQTLRQSSSTGCSASSSTS